MPIQVADAWLERVAGILRTLITCDSLVVRLISAQSPVCSCSVQTCCLFVLYFTVFCCVRRSDVLLSVCDADSACQWKTLGKMMKIPSGSSTGLRGTGCVPGMWKSGPSRRLGTATWRRSSRVWSPVAVLGRWVLVVVWFLGGRLGSCLYWGVPGRCPPS